MERKLYHIRGHPEYISFEELRKERSKYNRLVNLQVRWILTDTIYELRPLPTLNMYYNSMQLYKQIVF